LRTSRTGKTPRACEETKARQVEREPENVKDI